MEIRNQTVNVISLCSAEGEIRPIRLQLPGENQQMIRVDISRIIQVKDIAYIGAEARIFSCLGTIGNMECILELKYHFRNHIWELLKKSG